MVTALMAQEVLQALDRSNLKGSALRLDAMTRLSRLPGYDWSGIYRLEGESLILDEYVGAPTDHTRITVGMGVCGTAVKDNANQVIADVRELQNYLSCSLETRSEIVVLIHREGEILGQIDIDGHEVGAFDRSDEAFLERVAEVLARNW
jgi:L-methionine (R)-S-oxide reductase